MSNTYVATINVPGYLPMDDNPPAFDNAADAWQHLADERANEEDQHEEQPSGYTLGELRGLARMGVQAPINHSVVGVTPGYDGQHDLGLAYSVSLVREPSASNDW